MWDGFSPSAVMWDGLQPVALQSTIARSTRNHRVFERFLVERDSVARIRFFRKALTRAELMIVRFIKPDTSLSFLRKINSSSGSPLEPQALKFDDAGSRM